jgi:4-hydroxyphenylpyruvate dioxygenase
MVKEKMELESKQVQEVAIDGFDHQEFYVGNALQAAYYYSRGFGFNIIGYRGPETGVSDRSSYVLRQNQVTLVLTSALNPEHPIANHVHEHGDGVKAIGFRVRDARGSYELVTSRGAKAISPPQEIKDEYGSIITCEVATYGETIHRFVERQNYKGDFLPGYKSMNVTGQSTGLVHVDHIVGNVESDQMEHWVDFYRKTFGFYVYQYFDAEDISTQYSALVSKVMANKSGTIKMPINEPAMGLRKSQIQEYLDYYRAPGVQHIAISTRDIVQTVRTLQERGISFLTVPHSYYEELPSRVGKIDEDIELLEKYGILVDRESEGYLLQIFTKPVEDRPTLFFEVIQRKGAHGFGKGNFKALFESIEREQALRGNL